MKHISVLNIRDWKPKNANIDTRDAWEILKSFYCWRMVSSGVCPVECEKCKDRVVEMLSLDIAKNPKALLTYRAKDMAAKVVDQQVLAQEAADAKKVPVFNDEEFSGVGNPFLDLLDMMEGK